MKIGVVKYVLFYLLLIDISLAAIAQSPIEDLKHELTIETNSLKKGGIYIQLADAIRARSLDSSFMYAKAAKDIFEKETLIEKVKEAELFIGLYYHVSGKTDSSYQLAKKNIPFFEKNKTSTDILGRYYLLLGGTLMKQDKKKEALDAFYDAKKEAERINNSSLLLKANTNIGWVMMELNQHKEAIDKFKESIAITKGKGLSDATHGVIYNNMASSFGALNMPDSTKHYAKIAIEKAHKIGDNLTEANSLFILGGAEIKKGNLQDALDNYLKAQPLREKVGDPFYIVSDQAEIASLYAKLGNTKEGIAIGQKALKLAEEKNITAKLPMIYTALATNYETAKEDGKAIELYKKLNSLKDSMYADANPKALAEMKTRYETEKQERLIAHQKNKIRLQNFLFAGIGGLLILLMLLAFSQYKKVKLRQEAAFKTALLLQQEQAIKAVMEAEENERERIARDLHDGVGQMMSAAKMNLSAFESASLFTSVEQRKEFDKIIQLVDESCKEVRTVSHIMMPNALLKNNLAVAVSDFVNKLSNKNLSVHVYTEGWNERLDSNVEIVLYRIIQECVNNAIKHAGATKLDISLIKDKDGISGTIEDNGKGFDSANKENFEGIGLKNIITRIEYLKGTVDFDSAPGRGTLVALHVPL
jgi:two-component system, NarL family, sensor kinase